MSAGISSALAAAVLFGLSAPVSKLLLPATGPLLLAALLYLGAGLGLAAYALKRWDIILLPLTIFPFTLASSWALDLLTRHTPVTLDGAFWAVDGKLGFEPSVLLMVVLQTSPLLHKIAWGVYRGLPVAIVLAALIGPKSWRFALKMLVAGCVGYAFYWLLPACGPGYFLSGTVGPRNAMPSMHTVWAMMIRQRAARHSLGVRVATDGFLIFTILSTLGLGEHYLVDLLAAVPFWAAFEFLPGKVWVLLRPRPAATFEPTFEGAR